MLTSALMLAMSISPAWADWQGTRWGMSPDEVASAVPSAKEEKSGQVTNPYIHSPILVTAPYDSGQFHFKAFFAFKDRKLSEVMLLLNNWNTAKGLDKVLKLKTAMVNKYGQPDYVEGPITFGWLKGRDNILYGGTVIHYYSRASEDNSGL